jgi:hypothetical protein
VNLFVDNEGLCKTIPVRENSCNDMDSVRLQRKRIFELQDYIDAQYGGPGKGFFRIVTDPFEARRVANDGKLAVVLASRSRGCSAAASTTASRSATRRASTASSTRSTTSASARWRSSTSSTTRSAASPATPGRPARRQHQNRQETGRYWDMRTCDSEGPASTTVEQTTTGPARQDAIFGATFGSTPLLEPGSRAAVPGRPHCNNLGLSDLGEHLVRRMLGKGMIIDPDHLGVYAAARLLASSRPSATPASSHRTPWSTPDAEKRILNTGGFITPVRRRLDVLRQEVPRAAGRRAPALARDLGLRRRRQRSRQAGPAAARRRAEPGHVPLQVLRRLVTFERQLSGERTFDINKEGVAHYGLYADWFEDLRRSPATRSSPTCPGRDSYLRTWERRSGSRPRPAATAAALTKSGMGLTRIGIPSSSCCATRPADLAHRPLLALVRRGPRQRRPARAHGVHAGGDRRARGLDRAPAPHRRGRPGVEGLPRARRAPPRAGRPRPQRGRRAPLRLRDAARDGPLGRPDHGRGGAQPRHAALLREIAGLI